MALQSLAVLLGQAVECLVAVVVLVVVVVVRHVKRQVHDVAVASFITEKLAMLSGSMRARSLYGARGANGVILITTKEGNKGKAKVAFRYETKFSAPTQISSFLDGVEYMELYNRALRMRDPSAPLYYSKNKIEATRNNPDPNIYPNLNWYDELFS